MYLRSLMTSLAVMLSLSLSVPALSANHYIFREGAAQPGDTSTADEFNMETLRFFRFQLFKGDALDVIGTIGDDHDYFDFRIDDGKSVVELISFADAGSGGSDNRFIEVTLSKGEDKVGPVFKQTIIDTYITSPITLFENLDADGYTISVRGFGSPSSGTGAYRFRISTVPLPAAFWLFGSAFVALLGLRKSKR